MDMWRGGGGGKVEGKEEKEETRGVRVGSWISRRLEGRAKIIYLGQEQHRKVWELGRKMYERENRV